MRFTWDENKRQATLEARGLDFADAEKVFERGTFTWEDTRHSYGEPWDFSAWMSWFSSTQRAKATSA